jgi:hypothetical protein
VKQPTTPVQILKWLVVSLAVLALVIAGGVGGCAGLKAFKRTQARADANNQVAITHIYIRRAQQQADIVNAEIRATIAEANKRYQEAVGIRRAQDEISKTLTPLYIQHEAIQAEQAIATSGRNNTIVYVPSGAQGVPLVTQAAHP